MTDRELTGTSFYQFLGENKLMGSRCRSCGALHVPPRPMCPHCHSAETTWEEMSGEGSLVAFTTVHIAPTTMIEAGYDRKNPYCVGIVRLVEGPTISAQIVGVDATRPHEITIGMPLRTAFHRRGEGDKVQIHLAFEG